MVFGEEREEFSEENENLIHMSSSNEHVIQNRIDHEILTERIQTYFKNADVIDKVILAYSFGIRFDNYTWNRYTLKVKRNGAESEKYVIAYNAKKAVDRMQDNGYEILSTETEIKKSLEKIEISSQDGSLPELCEYVGKYFGVKKMTPQKILHEKKKLEEGVKGFLINSLRSVSPTLPSDKIELQKFM